MDSLTTHLTKSPLAARAAPLVLFVILTACQGALGENGRYWIYLAKTLVGAWMLWVIRPVVPEMRWKFSWEATVVGVGVFALWVGLDSLVPKQNELWFKLGLSKTPPDDSAIWNPFAKFGEASALAWFFVAVRTIGSSLVVPPIEEIFYRSFLYRWIAKPDFESVPLGRFLWRPFLITALIFGFAHNEWLAGILCAAAYQGLVCWKKRLGDAMTAHAITNLLLGMWVVWRGAWHFW